MAGEIAPLYAALPIVTTPSDRETRFPVASRLQNQRVYRLDAIVIERWTGSEWVIDFPQASPPSTITGFPALFHAFPNAWLDNGDSPLDTTTFLEIRCPRGTLIDATVTSDTVGSVTVDVYHATYAAQPTYTLISATAPLTLVADTKYQDLTLTGWTTAVGDGDLLKVVPRAGATLHQALVAFTLLRN